MASRRPEYPLLLLALACALFVVATPPRAVRARETGDAATGRSLFDRMAWRDLKSALAVGFSCARGGPYLCAVRAFLVSTPIADEAHEREALLEGTGKDSLVEALRRSGEISEPQFFADLDFHFSSRASSLCDEPVYRELDARCR